MATLHVMIGLPCSGKTTYARQLAGETNALLLILDVWHLKLFGHDVGHQDHDERHQNLQSGTHWRRARVKQLLKKSATRKSRT